MTAVTVKRFAEQIGVSEERLLQQLKNAGVLDKTIDGDLDDAEKTKLLTYLRGEVEPDGLYLWKRTTRQQSRAHRQRT